MEVVRRSSWSIIDGILEVYIAMRGETAYLQLLLVL